MSSPASTSSSSRQSPSGSGSRTTDDGLDLDRLRHDLPAAGKQHEIRHRRGGRYRLCARRFAGFGDGCGTHRGDRLHRPVLPVAAVARRSTPERTPTSPVSTTLPEGARVACSARHNRSFLRRGEPHGLRDRGVRASAPDVSAAPGRPGGRGVQRPARVARRDQRPRQASKSSSRSRPARSTRSRLARTTLRCSRRSNAALEEIYSDGTFA